MGAEQCGSVWGGGSGGSPGAAAAGVLLESLLQLETFMGLGCLNRHDMGSLRCVNWCRRVSALLVKFWPEMNVSLTRMMVATDTRNWGDGTVVWVV